LPDPHRAMLKWPNDLLISGAKLAGILLEREGDAVIIGVGVNLVSAPDLPDRTTVALGDLTTAPNRDQFAEALAAQFAVELVRWRAYGLAAVIARWLAAGHPPGTRLSADGQVGSFAGLTDQGLLQLRLSDGSLRLISAGEVSLG
jgi:BirA family transcriptional regulator, biotin operon repressor / biotin---[acetyl-CoA-carboxylase] ligase